MEEKIEDPRLFAVSVVCLMQRYSIWSLGLFLEDMVFARGGVVPDIDEHISGPFGQ